MGWKIAFLALSAFWVLIAPAASAQQSTYLSLKPDAEFCTSVVFGEHGNGEYVLTIDDPGYPDRPWADIHRASFTSGSSNPVIVPVCLSTEGRNKGDEAVLKFSLESPEMNVSYDLGLCVSDHEDIDVYASSEGPCSASSAHTDLFSMYLLEDELTAVPGEKATFTLAVSSGFDMRLTLDKESGPAMDISSASLDMPGDEMVDIVIEAPSGEGDYEFVITAKAADCARPSCEKHVTGMLHVSGEPAMQGFVVDLSPENRDVIGLAPATYFLTVRNFEDTQTFRIAVETDDSLDMEFEPVDITLDRNMYRRISIVVLPKSKEHRLHVIRALVEDGSGAKKTAEATLTVDEALGDAQRMAENDRSLADEVGDYADDYEAGASLDDWESINEFAAGDGQGLPGAGDAASPVSWIAIIIAAAALIGVFAFYIYKKARVTEEIESPYFQSVSA